MLRNLKITVQYDGTNYHGFQRQGEMATIQRELERVAGIITGEKVRITGAGRTDAGVHALGQVANFYTKSRIPADRLPWAMNSLLPPDIVVTAGEEVDMSFHSRRTARLKKYKYLILTQTVPSPFYRNYSWHLPEELDLAGMQEASQYLVGQHDFAAFRATGSSAKTTVRVMETFEVKRANEFLVFRAVANGFLYNMMRILVGTLVEVGRGKIKPSDLKKILDERKRELAGPTAPPHGLYLEEVVY